MTLSAHIFSGPCGIAHHLTDEPVRAVELEG